MKKQQHKLSHPLHLMVGFDLATTGLILLLNRRFFFWPPQPEIITAILNDSIVGFVGICLGLGMMAWAVAKNKSAAVDHWIITLSTAYYTIISMTELAHAFFGRGGFQGYMAMDAMSDVVMVGIALYMAKNSDSRD